MYLLNCLHFSLFYFLLLLLLVKANAYIILYNQKKFIYPVLYDIVTWDLSAFAFKYFVEDFKYLHHGAKTAVGTNVGQYTKLNDQKRVSMSGNRVDNNSFCSSVTVTVATSFF